MCSMVECMSMRNAAHGTLYALANSFAVTRAVAVPKWVKTTYAVDAVVAIILVAWEVCAICKYRKAKKRTRILSNKMSYER